MTSLASSLVPEAVKKLIPYQSARRIGGKGRIWLNANELETITHYGQQSQSYNRYPDFLPHDIAKAYQSYCHVTQPVVAVRGADEAIDLIIRTFCQPGKDKVLICPPTYAMYQFCADALAIDTIMVPLTPVFALDTESIIKQSKYVNIVFLCSPNNPTGNAIRQKDIVEVLEGTKDNAIVVVDEAYIEFSKESSVVSLIDKYPHLIVIRTLSKAFGLAAVRCGFIIADNDVMDYVVKLIPPYPLPDCSAEIVMDALSSEGLIEVDNTISQLIKVRNEFVQALEEFDFIEKVYPSATNFVLLKIKPNIDLFKALLDDGIVTRNQHHEPKIQNCIRITIGTQSSMLEVIKTLKKHRQ